MSVFGYPAFFWLFLSVLALGTVFAYSIRKMGRERLAFSSAEMMKRLGLGNGSRKFTARSLLILASAILTVIALARPLGPPANAEEVPVSMDVIVALDISDSMLVQDGGMGKTGDRLSAAKEFIKRLVDEAPGDRFGLVLFSGDSIISCPPTLDHDTYLDFLADADVTRQDLPGTAIGDALIAAATKFKKSNLPRAVVVVSDGENTYGPDPAGAAKAAGLKVYTVGVGTSAGGRIPEGLDFFGQPKYKRDRFGQTVVSSLREGALKSIAQAGGGRYFYSRDSGAVSDIAKELSPKSTEKSKEKFAGAQEYGPWFALGAALVLGMALIL
ncbi:MAG: vWA domain-containing protein [Nitrospirota bacterium]